VTFQSSFTITGAVNPSLDDNDKTALAQATATTLGFPSSACTTISSQQANAGRRLSAPLDDTYTLVATVQTQIAVSRTDYSSSSDLYDGSTAKLQSAVNNGDFTDTLHSAASDAGATDLTDAQTTKVSNSDATVDDPPSSGGGSSGGLSGGAVAGIVICVLFVVFGGAYYAYTKQQQGSASTTSGGTSGAGKAAKPQGYVVHEDDDVAIENPGHKEETHVNAFKL
jgi:hypothetical protein